MQTGTKDFYVSIILSFTKSYKDISDADVLVFRGTGESNNLSVENSFRESSTNLASLSEAVLSGMWAYSGW